MKKFFIFLTINCGLGLLFFSFGYFFFPKVQKRSPPFSFSTSLTQREETDLTSSEPNEEGDSESTPQEDQEPISLEANWKKITTQYLNNYDSKIVITYPFWSKFHNHPIDSDSLESGDDAWKLKFNNILEFYQIDALEGNSIQNIVAADSNLSYSEINPETRKELEALIKIANWEQKLNSLIWASQLYYDFIRFKQELKDYQIFKIKEIKIETIVQWMNDASKKFPPFYSYLLKESNSDEAAAKIESMFEKFINQFETAKIELPDPSETQKKWNLEYEINLIKKKTEDDWTEIKNFLLEKFTYKINSHEPLLEYHFNKIRDYNIIKIDEIDVSALHSLATVETEWKDLTLAKKIAVKNLVKTKDWKNKISERINVFETEIGLNYRKFRDLFLEKVGPVDPDSYRWKFGVQLRNKLKKYSILQISEVDVSPLHEFLVDGYNKFFRQPFEWNGLTTWTISGLQKGNVQWYLEERPKMKAALENLMAIDNWEQELEAAISIAKTKQEKSWIISETLKTEIEQNKDYYDSLFNFWKKMILPHQPKLKKYQISKINEIKFETIANLEALVLSQTEKMNIFLFFTFFEKSFKEKEGEQIVQELKILESNKVQIENFIDQFEKLYSFWKEEIAPYLIKLEKYQIDQIIGIKIDALIDLNYFVQNELKQINITNFNLYLNSNPKIKLQLEALLAKIASDQNLSDVKSKIIVEINESEQLQTVLDQLKKFSSYLKQYGITAIEGVSLVEILQITDQNLSIHQLKLQKEATFQKVKTKILALKKLPDYQTKVLRMIASAQNKTTRKESNYFIIAFLTSFGLLFLIIFGYFFLNKRIKNNGLLSFWKKKSNNQK